MRILVNHNSDDTIYRQNLMFLLKEAGLTGVASTKLYDISSIQSVARTANCDAVLLQHTDTLKALLGEKATLDKYRGTRINYDIPIIVANPTEHIHTVTYGKFLLKSDLKKFKRIKEAAQPFNFLVCDTEETQSQALAFMSQSLLISFDIETDAAPQITCISFACLHQSGSIAVFLVPLVDFDHVHYSSPDELADTLIFLRKVAALQVIKVAFNGIYDTQYMILYDLFPDLYLIDVMQLGWSKYAELPRALDFWCSLYLYDYFFWKDESDKAKSQKDIRGYWAYCCKDSLNTLRLLLELLCDLEEYQIFNYNETFRQTFPALYTAFQGIKINGELKAKGRAEAEARQNELLTNIRLMAASPTFNPGSPPQCSQLIYDVIGAKSAGKKGMERSTNAKILNRVSMQHPLLARVCGDIIRYREEAKSINQYYDVEEKNGRLLFNLDPTGTETARFSSKASSFWVGTQIQNIPSYFKYCLQFDGWGIEADKNKAEARCVAYASQDPELIKALEDLDKDFYKVVSTLFFGIPYEQVTDQMRNDVTKHIIHGTHHVMGHEPFIDTATPQTVYNSMKLVGWKAGPMEAYVKYLLSLYHKKFTRVKGYWKTDVFDVIAATHKTVSVLGWTRYFFGDVHRNHKVFRGGVAHQSQNLSVHLINREWWRLYKELMLPSNGEFRLIAQIHDSILAQCMNPSQQVAEDYTKEMKRIMTEAETVMHGRKMIMPVDVKMSGWQGFWGAYDEKTFPLGMKKVKLI